MSVCFTVGERRNPGLPLLLSCPRQTLLILHVSVIPIPRVLRIKPLKPWEQLPRLSCLLKPQGSPSREFPRCVSCCCALTQGVPLQMKEPQGSLLAEAQPNGCFLGIPMQAKKPEVSPFDGNVPLPCRWSSCCSRDQQEDIFAGQPKYPFHSMNQIRGAGSNPGTGDPYYLFIALMI